MQSRLLSVAGDARSRRLRLLEEAGAERRRDHTSLVANEGDRSDLVDTRVQRLLNKRQRRVGIGHSQRTAGPSSRQFISKDDDLAGEVPANLLDDEGERRIVNDQLPATRWP